MNRIIYITFFSFLLIASSCGTSESITERGGNDDSQESEPYFNSNEEIEDDLFRDEIDELDRYLYDSRSSLSDQFSSIKQEIPEQFLKEAIQEEYEADEFAGFRVQIISTRDVTEADSTIDEFRAWSAENLDQFEVEAYIFFRQPYYRVRAGDFRDRNRANDFARLLKDHYPDAWVVHDRIDPNQIPDSMEENNPF